ncbi:MAG: sodium:calcium antiporter, partial [Clostridia bacterium]|nr:sodium:calcium antiporter [Clostridia bacterium]
VCFFFGVAVFYAINAYAFRGFALWSGIVLLAAFVVYMVVNVINMKNNPEEDDLSEDMEIAEAEAEEPQKGGLIKELGLLILGAAVIAVGAYLLVESATDIAHQIGVPESVIGLTVVAIGTSLPELVTAITSLVKGHGSLSLGNIIGANIFNLVLVSGVAITINPFTIPMNSMLFGQNASLVLDLPVMFIVMGIMTLPALFTGKLKRWQGISMLAIYVAFMAAQFLFVQSV